MVTARIGTSCSLACGELAVWTMPSFHELVCAASERKNCKRSNRNRIYLSDGATIDGLQLGCRAVTCTRFCDA
jgi:hypothetical protein